tara:strand:+ start:4435 stop:5493 length:1059 start_codon:yes stop_codon:yes gene_type:complete
MSILDKEWINFKNAIKTNAMHKFDINSIKKNEMPKCSDIYISTQTKIVYLNTSIDLNNVFWQIPIINYYLPKIGVLKKSIKINTINKDDISELEAKIDLYKRNGYKIFVTDLSKNKTKNTIQKKKIKDVRKIDIGISKKDLTSYKSKQKGAFYNCFALILRIFYNNEYKEIHVKVFNTGKLEIPGIQYDETLIKVLNQVKYLLKNITKNNDINYKTSSIQTVLMNSNFTCKYFIDRFKLFKLLKYKYRIQTAYDPCSYPGIQSKFCYHPQKNKQDGVYDSALSINEWKKISFMIFRTGSVLIVGNCNKQLLIIIYNFLKKILSEEYKNICTANNLNIIKKKKKIRKKYIYLT